MSEVPLYSLSGKGPSIRLRFQHIPDCRIVVPTGNVRDRRKTKMFLQCMLPHKAYARAGPKDAGTAAFMERNHIKRQVQ